MKKNRMILICFSFVCIVNFVVQIPRECVTNHTGSYKNKNHTSCLRLTEFTGEVFFGSLIFRNRE
jgi:hypothetical protein